MNPAIPPPPLCDDGDVVIVATEGADGPSRIQRNVHALLVSAIVHLVVLILLAVWFIPALANQQKLLMEASIGDTEDVSFAALEVPEEIEFEAEEEAQPAEVRIDAEVEPIEIELQTGTEALQSLEPETPFELVSLETPASPITPAAASGSIEQAVDSITGQLESKLNDGDLLVVWLLDASASLVDDRQRVAERLTPFYERIAARQGANYHQLSSAVVSFGTQMRERIPPTEFGDRVVATVEKLPVDRSGNERVFDAVMKCAQHYRGRWKNKQLMFVIWTDESGDDVAYLEQAIAVCRKHQVTVSVVGPSAVLGADTGLHSYRDPKSGSTYQLPVRRGPDSPLRERIELGYWYITGMGGFRRMFRGNLPSWMGGQDLEGMLSGFSPYALTRLTLGTGGSYTIFDRPEDRGPFDYDTMKEYAPSYAAVGDYQDSVRKHPLRKAIMDAVDEFKGKKVDAPTTMFFTKKTGDRHFDFVRYYYPPREFRSRLANAKGRLIRQADNASRVIDRALKHLSSDDSLEHGLDDLYAAESSPRWKAWYLLTRGRLLANSVRLEEYRLTVAAMTSAGFLDNGTNYVTLSASQRHRSSGKYARQADEAEKLLRDCVDEHRRTPWEVLAQRELDFALGVQVNQQALRPTGPAGPAPRQPVLPKF